LEKSFNYTKTQNTAHRYAVRSTHKQHKNTSTYRIIYANHSLHGSAELL